MNSTQVLGTTEIVAPTAKNIKLLVWDLDNTLWHGTLLEGDRLELRDGIRSTLQTLDQRGILHSIASKNDYDLAMAKLTEFGLSDFFLYPQINWNSKAANLQTIVKSINIGLDAVAFIDDEPFEREEVSQTLPQVLTLDSHELSGLCDRTEFIPSCITDESAQRRIMYLADIHRKRAEEEFVGPSEEFLATLNMTFSIAKAQELDLKRAEELTLRTHQLNTTGETYSYDDLNTFRQSSDHLLLVAGLEDRFGSYGKIGLALVQKTTTVWTIKLFLMSCRVMSRGVGTIFINHLLMQAREAGVRLLAPFRPNGRNRMMLITYKFAGFREIARSEEQVMLEHDLTSIQPHPKFVNVCIAS